jgi:hypothetical protein
VLKCLQRHIPVPRHGALELDDQQIAADARMVAQALQAPIQRPMGCELRPETECVTGTASTMPSVTR